MHQASTFLIFCLLNFRETFLANDFTNIGLPFRKKTSKCFFRKENFTDIVFFVNIFVDHAFIYHLNTLAMHTKSSTHNGIVMFPLKHYMYHGGIRSRVFCSCGGCDVHCATPPRPDDICIFFLVNCNKEGNVTCKIVWLDPGWPDWANFRPKVDRLFWVNSYMKMTEEAQFLVPLYSTVKCMH
jgi:hypothetical protein